ncbi:MAG: endonuclease dU [Nitrososphaerales archaeon]
MHVHVEKKGIRALGIAESFKKGQSKRSILAGIVMRSDMIVDGFIFGSAEIGGDDTTDEIANMFQRLNRNDINVIILGGSVISMYNIIDIDSLGAKTNTPVISVTFGESEGLEPHIKHHFPDSWEKKLLAYKKLGGRDAIKLHTNYTVYVRPYGISLETSKRILDKFTIQGAIPEPIRLARLLARAKIASNVLK